MSWRELFHGRDELYIRQRREWVEIVVDWETRNQYAILDAAGVELGVVVERAGGALDALRRGVLRSHRPFQASVFDAAGEALLQLSRPFFWLFSELSVDAADGRPLGRVRRRFGLLYKRYDLVDPQGLAFAQLKSPLWRLWTFPVLAGDGREVATISKRWGGVLREVFSDADTYQVDFGTGPWSDEHRALIMAAAIAIDFDFFENNQGRGGLAGSFGFGR
jgi:uncharacterized protein YxjI